MIDGWGVRLIWGVDEKDSRVIKQTHPGKPGSTLKTE
jgi:hypothetical protein